MIRKVMLMSTYTNRLGWTFAGGFAIPPATPIATHTVHTFNPATDEPNHATDRKPFHCTTCRVMETEGVPVSADFQYRENDYVYVHEHAYNTNPNDALECRVTDVSGAPLYITVEPCNHPELTRVVRQDQLSAPIRV